jgi:hypothetical protein
MFRRLEGYENDQNMLAWSAFKQDQTKLATTTLVPSTRQPSYDINDVVRGLTPSANIDIESSMSSYATALGQLNAMNDTCTGLNMKTISDAINLNESGPIQCGWYYNKGTGSLPQVNQGYLSTKQGPVVGLDKPLPQQPYTFYFGNNSGTNRFVSSSSTTSLQAGQERIDKERCKVEGCSAVTGLNGCGYCAKNQTGIPIDANGRPKYQSATCSDPVIISSAQCPTISPTANANGGSLSIAANADADATTSDDIIRIVNSPNVSSCSPETNGRFSGACLQSVLRDSGCGTRGSLSLALNGFSSETNIDSLAKKSNIIKQYGEANPTFLTNFLGATTKPDAQALAKALSDASKAALANAIINPTRQTKQNTLAIDLCTKKGYFLDNYNFCMELDLQPETAVPSRGWDLVCLQRAWKAAGLWPQGKGYPTIYNLKDFNRFGKWSEVTKYMNDMYTEVYNGGPIVESFSGTTEYTSPPFMLRAENFLKYWTYMGAGRPLMITDRVSNSTTQQFVWRPGSIPETIRIFPVSDDTSVLRHSFYELKPFPKNANDTGLLTDSTFYVRSGNINTNMVSFEAINVAGNNSTLTLSDFFLRHYGNTLLLNKKNGTPIFNKDSTFQPVDLNLAPLFKSFFTKPPAEQVDPAIINYPGQVRANSQGWGQKLEAPRIIPTSSGMEVYECKYRQRGIYIITKYSVASSYPSVSSNRIDALFTLTNYSTDTTMNVTPTLKLGDGDVGAIAVNSYLTGWGWQSGQVIESNQFGAINELKKYNLNTRNGRYPGRANGYNQMFGYYELKGSQMPNIVKTQWWNGGRGGQFDYSISPAANKRIVRDANGPFMRFEPFGPTAFCDIRLNDMRNNPYNSGLEIGVVSYNTTADDKLANPGSNGYVTITDHIFINYVDAPIWNIATFVFSVNFDSILQKDQSILYVGNAIQPDSRRFWETADTNGFKMVARPNSSSTSSYNLAIQSISANRNVKETSVAINLTKTSWYMAVIDKLNGKVVIYTLTRSGAAYAVSSTPKGTIVIPSYTLDAFKDNKTLPRIRIGDAPSAIRINVAFLHLFDTTITSVDPSKELIGYAPGGYERGVF